MQKPILALATVALLAACGSNQALLARRTQSEAQQLQQYCRKAGLSNPETVKADQSLQSAAAHLADGKEDVAASESDLSATLSRLALARKELTDAQGQGEELKKGLGKEKDELESYQEILSEMKATRKP